LEEEDEIKGINDNKFNSIPTHKNNQLFDISVIKILEVIDIIKIVLYGRKDIIKKKRNYTSIIEIRSFY